MRYTVIGSSAFTAGTRRYLTDRGIEPLPWADVRNAPFDIAVAASHGGPLDDIDIPLIILPHGMGYNKTLATGRPEARKPVFGLSPEWLLHQGMPIASSLVLSHAEQRDRLAGACPEAVDTAVVAGDPCLDRMIASAPLRPAYRRALGVADGRRLVVVSSTWGALSLFGAHPELVGKIAARLPLDDFRIVVALHPNTWHWHSPWQVERWTRAWRRAGVTLLPPEEGWRTALVAADVVIGDYGSVTFYAAALGRPTLVAAAPPDVVAPDSAIGRFLDAAPRYDHAAPPAEQLSATIDAYDPLREPLASVAALATSAPGRSAALLRKEFYRLLGLSEPADPADTPALPLPTCDIADAGAHAVRVDIAGGAATVTRYPAAIPLPEGSRLCVDLHEPWRRMLDLAEIVVVPDARDAAETLASMPGCLLATGPLDAESWLVVDSAGVEYRCRGVDGRLGASVVHAYLDAGLSVPDEVSVRVGGRVVSVEFS